MGKAKSFTESNISDKEAYLLKSSQRFMSESYRRNLHRMILENKIKFERMCDRGRETHQIGGDEKE